MWTSMQSPVGELRIVADGRAVTAIEFVDVVADAAAPRSSVSRAAARAADLSVAERDDAHPLLVEAVRQLEGYFAGRLRSFDLPVAPVGTPFQQQVWEQLRGVGYGETVSYGEIARRLGLRPVASRAVGSANGRNPVPIVVPCHRVVGSTGTLTGYAGGLDRKKALLALEQDALF